MEASLAEDSVGVGSQGWTPLFIRCFSVSFADNVSSSSPLYSPIPHPPTQFNRERPFLSAKNRAHVISVSSDPANTALSLGAAIGQISAGGWEKSYGQQWGRNPPRDRNIRYRDGYPKCKTEKKKKRLE